MSTIHRDNDYLHWGHSALAVLVATPSDAPPSLVHLAIDHHEVHQPGQHHPLVEIQVGGHGRAWSGTRSTGTAVGRRLRYDGHHESVEDGWHHLRVDVSDPGSGLRAEVWFATPDGVPALRTWTVVHNPTPTPLTLRAVSTVVANLILPAGAGVEDVDLHWAQTSWLAENRWRRQPVRELDLPDLDLPLHGHRSRDAFVVTSTGSWSTKHALPVGVLVHRPTGRSWCWQIEHNGSWRWEVGEREAGLYLTATGPNDSDHQWRHVLAPGAHFTSVPVGMAVTDGGLDGAAAAITRYRRHIVRPHPDRRNLPVVFNDYMNTLMGEPTSEALNPLIEAAAAAGAEYFCIDAGWHDDSRSARWHELMGEWIPSTTRFTHGLGEVIGRIRAAGMVPGLWLEPEVVGVDSPVAADLPADAFFQRDGERLIEDGRHHLDLRHPAARAHLDGVVDRLVGDLGIGYFKLDYNIDSGAGTDVAAASPGDGLLGHGRAVLAWLDGVLDRHPDLVIENCASGAMRMDYAMLARLQLQSTSDQQNPERYPPIAAAAPMSVLPEQAGNWAYPQPGMTAETIAFCLVTGMTGRLYLSGHLDLMTADQHRLVADGVSAYRGIRDHLARAVPCWPAGLPDWSDPWITLGLRPPDGDDQPTYLALWRRPGADQKLTVHLPHLAGRRVEPKLVYPHDLPHWQPSWEPESGRLTVLTPDTAPSARLFALVPES